MSWNKKLLRPAALVTLALLLVRLLCSCTMGKIFDVFAQPELAAFLIQSGTGKQPDLSVLTEPATTRATEPVTEPEPTTEPPEPVTMPDIPDDSYAFAPADTSYVEMNYSASRKPDIGGLLTQSLSWDLTGSQPSVLIYHTHGTEAFTPTQGNTYQEEGGEYRTTNTSYNMISLGEELARLLNEAGIRTVHDKTFYDYPDYLASYDNARIGLQEQLDKYPSVKLVIDLHRDAATYEDGTQWATEAIINGEKSAQIMLVMGTDVYYTNPNWEQNLGVALKLNAVMEKVHAGATRPLDLRKQRFNQDLRIGSVIAEIGAAGNTHEEAMNAVSVLAEAIILLSKGANT